MASEAKVNLCLATISASYPGKFELSTSVKKTWRRLLGDIDDVHLMVAVDDLCRAGDKWPPSVPEVRARALDLQAGELAPVSAYEAWERVRRSLHDETVQLTDIERAAKNQIGGSWQIRNDQSGMCMHHFIKAYDALVAKQRRLRMATPEAKQIAARNAPALPSPKQPRELPPLEINKPGPTEVREHLEGLVGYRPAGGEG